MTYVVGIFAMWCAILFLILMVQARAIESLKRNLDIESKLWRDQLSLNNQFDRDITRLENRTREIARR